MTAALTLAIVAAACGLVLGVALARYLPRGRAVLGRARAPDEAPAPARRKCEIRRYVYADGSEWTAHTVCDGASEGMAWARVKPDGPDLVAVEGVGTHELA